MVGPAEQGPSAVFTKHRFDMTHASHAPSSDYRPLDTAWVRSLRAGIRPTEAQLRDHLLAVHARYAGFTESCARRCVDPEGRNSYQWLAELVEGGDRVLDLACGSGVLLEICHERFGEAVQLSGVDMSADELALARTRLGRHARLQRAFAQELRFAKDASFDVVLCHWALAQMDPIEPVLQEIARVLADGGRFGAIVDGEPGTSVSYDGLDELIFEWVAAECPGYANCDLGDARLRRRAEMERLVSSYFPDAEVSFEPSVVRLTSEPSVLAREAVGFYYASFVLSEQAHARMLEAVEAFFESGQSFEMPIHRLVVRR